LQKKFYADLGKNGFWGRFFVSLKTISAIIKVERKTGIAQ